MNEVAEVLDSYLRALESGNAPNREALLARHASIAEELAVALDGLDFVHRAGRDLAGAPGHDEDAAPGKALGDYRLLRELGRGGMAVVYEAEQVSLGRRVALKVLPFAAVLDPKHLQRFKNEAMAAAHLHHPNIVPVYGVGCERGVHYYAMQFVEGQSLATAIRDLKGRADLRSSEDTRPASTEDGPKTPISSHGSNREPAYIQMAAALGIQAAQALDHAHQLGIVHRDVKPGNLLADLAGNLWVTDFGLASSKKDVGLTITGELLGTIRYMSPEQALAKRVPIDHRTDVYSLGATLYELFTLEPAFPGVDAHLIIQDIAFKEPVLPRRLNPALPRDLETVILKAMSKDPAGRYATAQEMADDLGRFLEDRPIEARRPSLAARAAKWSRRHRGLVAASFVVLLLAIAALVADNFRVGYEQRKTSDALRQAMANLRLARRAVDKFLLEVGVANFEEQPLPPPARCTLLESALEFYETNLEDPQSLWRQAEILHALHKYEESLAVFDRYLAIQPGDADAFTQRGHQLWHLGRAGEALTAFDRSIEIDPTSARTYLYRGNALCDLGRVREAITARYRPAASNRSIEIDALQSPGRLEEAATAYREAIRLEPDHAVAHCNLGLALLGMGDPDGAMKECREAIRLEPGFAEAHGNLGIAVRAEGNLDEAIREFREAVRLRPELAGMHNSLGSALEAKGDPGGAIQEYREAIRFDPDHVEAHNNLGLVYLRKGDLDGAIHEYRESIRLDPHHAPAHDSLGCALRNKGELDEAIREHSEAIRLDPDYLLAHNNLGVVLLAKGDLDGAIREYQEAIRLEPDRAAPHNNLGMALSDKGDSEGAMQEYREALRLEPGFAPAHNSLGIELLESDPDGAMREYREAIRLWPDYAEAHCNLGRALARQGRFREAIPSLRRGHELGSKRSDWRYPSKQWVEAAERKAELEGHLDPELSGEAQPRDALERIDFAEMLYARARHGESAKMYAEAFAEDAALAEDLAKGHRYNAACSASLAAALGAADPAEWRGRALEWLRADLAAREKANSGLVAMLEHWKRDPDLAGVRDRLGDLPAGEREGWTELWAAVDRTSAAARPAAR